MALRVTELSEARVRVEVRVAPRASREAVLGEHDGALKVALTAPPVEGAANAALVAFVARLLGLPKRGVVVERGHTSKQKTLLISGTTADAVRALAKTAP